VAKATAERETITYIQIVKSAQQENIATIIYSSPLSRAWISWMCTGQKGSMYSQKLMKLAFPTKSRCHSSLHA